MRQKRNKTEPELLRKGKAFEKKEKRDWTATRQNLDFEKVVIDPTGKKGRIDIFVPQAGENLVSVAEIKATNWDKIPKERIRPNVLRHARQIWRYIESQLDSGLDVSPGLIYPRAPRRAAVRVLVEELLNARGIQCVWRKKIILPLDPADHSTRPSRP